MKLEEVHLRDTRANQPAATTVPAGTLYYVTDEHKTERSTGAAWEDTSDSTTASPHAMLDGSIHSDTVAHTVVRGDIMVGNSTPKWGALAKGTVDQVLTMGADDPAWSDLPVVTSIPDFINNAVYWQDFLYANTSTSGIPSFISFGTGTPSKIPSETNHPGIYHNSISSAGGFFMDGNTSMVDFAALFDMTWIVRITSNSNIKMRAGVMKSTGTITADPPGDGIYIEFIAGTDSNFIGLTRDSSTNTRTDTGIAVNTNFNKFRIRRIDASTIGFTANAGTEVTSTTNIPTGFGMPLFQVVPTSGSKQMDIDLFSIVIPVTR